MAQAPNPSKWPLVTLPFARGEKIFTSRRQPGGGVSFCVQRGLEGKPKVLLDSRVSPLNATEPLPDFAVSDDGKLCAYFTPQEDSRYEAINIVDVDSGKKLNDTISWTHRGDFGWEGKGFYYGAYQKPVPGSTTYSDERVYFHRLGTSSNQDPVVYSDVDHPTRKYQFLTSYDHRFFLLHVLERVQGKLLVSEWFRREGKVTGAFQALQGTMAPGRFYIIDNAGDHLFLYTQYRSPGGRIIDVDTNHPAESSWVTVLQEPVGDGEPLLGKIAVLANQPGGGNRIKIYSYSGKLEREVPTPVNTKADIQACPKGQKYVFVSVEKQGVESYYRYDYRANSLTAFE